MKYIWILILSYFGLISTQSDSRTEYLYTPDSSLYQNWIDPQEDFYNGSFCFDVRSDRDTFIMFSDEPLEDIFDGSNIEINFGCCLGSNIEMRSNGERVEIKNAIQPDVLKLDQFNNYCITWNNGRFSLYRGDALIISHKRRLLLPVKVIGFRKWFTGGASWIFTRN